MKNSDAAAAQLDLRKRRRRIVGMAILGMAIAAAMFSYAEITNYKTMPPTLIVVVVLLCPPSLLSIAFLDLEPHTLSLAFGWLLIGMANAALYAAIGRWFWNPRGGIKG
jgi:drug/metabolite transporter (DMT)-like permease